MKEKLSDILLPIFLSIFFYAEILLISIRSSEISWIFNLVMLIWVINFLKNKFQFSLRKFGLSLYSIWVFFSFILIFIDLFNYIDITWAVKHFFVYFIQLPALALIIYCILNSSKYTFTFEIVSFILSIVLFISLKVGVIPDYKYQIVGNIALLALIFILLNPKRSKKNKFSFFLFLFLVIIFCGSRQSLIGLLIFCILFLGRKFVFYLRRSLTTKFIGFSLLAINIVLLSLVNFEVQNIQVVVLDEFGLTTISRLVSNFSLDESDSNNYRIRSLEMLVSNFSFFPNGYLYLDEVFFLEPHNFFIEILFSYGYLMSFFIYLLFLYTWYLLFSKSTKIHFGYLVAVFLVPTFVSSGLHAARFFLIFLLGVSLFKNIKYDHEN
jgi:hypothetical protein